MADPWESNDYSGGYDTSAYPSVSASDGISYASAVNGTSQLLGNLANIWGGVEVAKIKASTPTYFRGADGRLYQEGKAGRVVSQNGQISPLMLLLIAGVAIVALKN